MDIIESAINIKKLRGYMASVDLREAYKSILVKVEYRTFLHFIWKG